MDLSSINITTQHMLGSYVTIYKRAGVACVEIANLRNLSPEANTTLFTLPSSHYPLDLMRWDIYRDGRQFRLAIQKTGTVEVYLYGSSQVATTGLSFTCVWVTKD